MWRSVSSGSTFGTGGLASADLAILDVNLNGEETYPLADSLAARAIPFIFATGYGEGIMIPDRFTSIPIVSKPYDGVALRAALSNMRHPDGTARQ